jgi:hypothetical protein
VRRRERKRSPRVQPMRDRKRRNSRQIYSAPARTQRGSRRINSHATAEAARAQAFQRPSFVASISHRHLPRCHLHCVRRDRGAQAHVFSSQLPSARGPFYNEILRQPDSPSTRSSRWKQRPLVRTRQPGNETLNPSLFNSFAASKSKDRLCSPSTPNLQARPPGSTRAIRQIVSTRVKRSKARR